MLGVLDRQLEASLEAMVAHAVSTLELCCLAWSEIIHTDDTFNTDCR